MADDKGKKGFAALDAMISEVEAPKPVSAEPVRQPEPTDPPHAEPQPVYAAPPSSTGGSGKWWGVAIGIVVLIIWATGSDKKSSARPASSPSYSAPSYSSPSYSPPAPSYVPEPASAYVSNEEQMPPVGSGLSFNRAQIRYCLSEKIRISAWQSQVNEYSETSVDAFNMAVNDYNMRCSNFRYRSGALESVRSEVEANRYALQLQGTASAAANP